MELFAEPRLANSRVVLRKLRIGRRCAFLRERGENCLRSEHPALQRCVRALDLGGIQQSGIAADEQAARKRQSRQRLKAAFVDGTRAVRNSLAAGEYLADSGMLLPTLEFRERIEMRIAIAQGDDQTQVHARVGGVIEETAAVGRSVERPAERVHDLSGPVLRRIDLPNLLEADAVMLRVDAGAQAKTRFEPP